MRNCQRAFQSGCYHFVFPPAMFGIGWNFGCMWASDAPTAGIFRGWRMIEWRKFKRGVFPHFLSIRSSFPILQSRTRGLLEFSLSVPFGPLAGVRLLWVQPREWLEGKWETRPQFNGLIFWFSSPIHHYLFSSVLHAFYSCFIDAFSERNGV